MKNEQLQQSVPAWLMEMQKTWYTEWIAIADRKQELQELGLSIIEELGRAPLKTEFGDFTLVEFGDRTTGYEHRALVYGDIENGAMGDGEDMLLRIHSACWTSEVGHAVNCECREEKDEALEAIAKEGRGVFLYLQQEGRGTGGGKIAKLVEMLEWGKDGEIRQRQDENGVRIDTDRAYKNAGYPSECRDFDCAGEMLRHLGVKSVRLLTNNPRKIEGIERFDIKVEQIEIHIKPTNSIVAADLKSKYENLGHTIDQKHWEV